MRSGDHGRAAVGRAFQAALLAVLMALPVAGADDAAAGVAPETAGQLLVLYNLAMSHTALSHDQLATCLASEAAVVRDAVIGALPDLKVTVTDALMATARGLADPHPRIRFSAAETAATLPSAAAAPLVPRLRELLGDAEVAPAARHALRRLVAWQDAPLSERASSLRAALGPLVGDARAADDNIVLLPSARLGKAELDRSLTLLHVLRQVFQAQVGSGAVWSPLILILAADHADHARLRDAALAGSEEVRRWFADDWRCAVVDPGEEPRLLGVSCLRTLVGDDDRLGHAESVCVPGWLMAGMADACLRLAYRDPRAGVISDDLQRDLLVAWLHREQLSSFALPALDASIQSYPPGPPALPKLFVTPLSRLQQLDAPYAILASELVRDLMFHHELATVVAALSAQQSHWHSRMALQWDLITAQPEILARALGMPMDQLLGRLEREVILTAQQRHQAKAAPAAASMGAQPASPPPAAGRAAGSTSATSAAIAPGSGDF